MSGAEEKEEGCEEGFTGWRIGMCMLRVGEVLGGSDCRSG